MLPKNPRPIGITKKNSINKPWALTITLYNCPLPCSICGLGPASSKRINILRPVATKPENIENIIYNIAISLQFVLYNHLVHEKPLSIFANVDNGIVIVLSDNI